MKHLILLIAFSIPCLVFAQKEYGNLTVFSEDGDKFFLVLNGEKQNDKAQANIRIEELPQPYYSAKIIFEDSAIGSISKNLQITDFNNKMMDVTYRLKKDKMKKVKLNPYSAIEVTPEFVVPQGMYVRRFGQGGRDGSVTRTTTTTTASNNMDASVSVPGVSMNISINDPDAVTTHTTTTTTTTHSSHSSHSGTVTSTEEEEPVRGNNNCRGWAMKTADFNAAKKSVDEASFEATKLSTAKSIISANCFSSDQVTAMCNLFSFEETKLEFAKYAYAFTIDPKNYFKVNSVFSFDASKEELSNFTNGK